jgi:hypothetical protein
MFGKSIRGGIFSGARVCGAAQKRPGFRVAREGLRANTQEFPPWRFWGLSQILIRCAPIRALRHSCDMLGFLRSLICPPQGTPDYQIERNWPLGKWIISLVNGHKFAHLVAWQENRIDTRLGLQVSGIAVLSGTTANPFAASQPPEEQ